jgi:hypothetical protein
MNNEKRVLVAKELASQRYYNEEKFMLLLRSVPDDVIEEWVYRYSENVDAYLPFEETYITDTETDSETDDDLDERDANGTVLSVDVNSVYPN